MVYFIFILQLYLIVLYKMASFFSKTLHAYIFFIIVAALLSIVLFLLVKFEVPKFPVLVLTFAVNPFLISESNYYNLIPFVSLYFFLVNKLKENEVFHKKFYFYLLPLVLLGFMPNTVGGIFEKSFYTFIKGILSFFFGQIEGSVNPTPRANSGVNIGDAVKKIFDNNVYQGDTLTTTISIVSILLSILMLIMLGTLFKNVLISGRNNQAKQFKPFKIEFLIFILYLLGLFSVLIFYNLRSSITFTSFRLVGFNAFYFVGLLLIYTFIFFLRRYSIDRAQRIYKYNINNKFSKISMVVFLILVIGLFFTLFFYRGNQKDEVIIAFLFISSLLSVLLIFLANFNGLNSFDTKTIPNVFKETSQRQMDIYNKYGISYLSSIKDPKEYIRYLYLIALIKLYEKGFKFESFFTPYDILKRVSNYLDSDIFYRLTLAFYIVEYSNEQLDEELFNYIFKNKDKLLNDFERIDFTKQTLEASQ